MMCAMVQLTLLRENIISLAKRAAQAILELYKDSSQYSVTEKPDHSPLTQADVISHQILVNGLQQLTLGVPVLSEEGAMPPWEERKDWTHYWLLDPLDGTRQFIKHTGEFAVNIALIENHHPVFGLIYIPVTGECYYAQEGEAAYKQDAQGNKTTLHVRHWSPEQTILLTSQAAQEKTLKKRFGYLGEFSWNKMSSAWKFCQIAEGRADLSPRFGDTSEWDTAAGQCILEQAGGALLDLQGEPLRYNMQASVVNPHFIALGDVALREHLPWGNWE